MTKQGREIGQSFEGVARQYLERQGLRCIAQNFQCKMGEIDLICQQGDTLIFVEVKYRQHQKFGHAAEMVTASKAKKIIRCAHFWLTKQGLNVYHQAMRFDVVAIHQQGQHIDWITNAITQD